jgi:uncharacterized protein (TIGR02186 family)
MIRAMVFAVLLCTSPANAEKIVAGLSENRVAITANFDGAELLIYGAVKREEPAPTDFLLDIIITVEGPSTPVIIRRKERTSGIWINRASQTIDDVPSFYSVQTTGPLAEILSPQEDERYKITIESAVKAQKITGKAIDSTAFVQALHRIRENEGRYRVGEGMVRLSQETLFRTDVVLPSNLTEGGYKVRIFLLRGGKVVDFQENLVGVRKAGLERFLFRLAHDQPLIYGLVSLLIAAIAGWAASAGFRFLRR